MKALLGMLLVLLPVGAAANDLDDARRGLDDAKRGFQAAQRGDYEEALYFSSRALYAEQLDARTLAIIFNNRGFALDQLGSPARAIADYTAALDWDPNFAIAYNNRGYAQAGLGLYESAIEDFNKAVQIKPDYADAYNNRGIANSQRGRTERAIEDYTQAIRLKPTLYQAYNNRGYAQFHAGNYSMAARDLALVVRVTPVNGYAVVWRYFAAARAGQDADAMLAADARSVDLDTWPGQIVRLMLGEISAIELAARGEIDPQTTPTNRLCEYYFYVGMKHALSGRYAEARAAFQRAIAVGNVDFTEYRTALVELERLGKTAQADPEAPRPKSQ